METARSLTPNYTYYRDIFCNIRKPFAFLDLNLLDENIQRILRQREDKKIRVASKSVRCLGVLQRIMNTCPEAFSGVMAFTAEEAVFLAKNGFKDILIGYPVWSHAAIQEVGQVSTDGTTITLMVDSVEHLRHLNTIGRDTKTVLRVCLDIDMSTDFPGIHFGVYRSPVRSVEDAIQVVIEAASLPFIRLEGVMGYEAQIAGVGDNYPKQAVKNRLVRQLKRRSLKPIAQIREQIVNYIKQSGINLRLVNGGGTGSLSTTVCEDVVTEMTVGSGFYAPGLFDNYTSFRYQPAIGYAIEIVRQPEAGVVTCAGGGYVASGSAAKDKLPKPYLPEGLELINQEGAGEVQTPLRIPKGVKLSLGDPVFMRHSKAGELCERFVQLYCVEDGKIVDVMPTYRGDGQCFL